MINEIRINNYKSIQKLKINVGRTTVLIGENGSGKTNILEAIALASAAANNKPDNEFLASRGIRVTEPQFMRSAFNSENISKDIYINFSGDDNISFKCRLQNDNEPYSKWQIIPDELLKSSFEKAVKTDAKFLEEIVKTIKSKLDETELKNETEINIKDALDEIVRSLFVKTVGKLNLHEFIIYSPENFSLRIFEKEGQIEPLGINGEGLFKLLKVLGSKENTDRLKIIKEKLRFINWFKDFEIPARLSEREKYIRIKDKYLDDNFAYFDQKSSNEGFLFLLFYFALFASDDTPRFFSIDNIDASLNPKLCRHLVKELVDLGKKFDKQAIFTTHNPAVLDGLNLDDPDQKLFVVFRNKLGYTKIKPVSKPKTPEGQEPVRLSEAFLRGYIGGLPKGF